MNPLSTTYSPWLGLLTAFFEIGAGIWILHLRQLQIKNPHRKEHFPYLLIALTQFLLAGYQLSEVVLCWNETVASPTQHLISRLAFLDITWLPPLSILIISRLLPTSPRWLTHFGRASVLLALAFSFWILVDYRFVSGTICSYMFAKYQHIEPYIHLYGAFYEITQMSMIFIPATLFVGQPLTVQKDLRDILLGALLFILPALFLAAAKHEVFAGALPSLMCHFALFYALFLFKMVYRRTS